MPSCQQLLYRRIAATEGTHLVRCLANETFPGVSETSSEHVLDAFYAIDQIVQALLATLLLYDADLNTTSRFEHDGTDPISQNDPDRRLLPAGRENSG